MKHCRPCYKSRLNRRSGDVYQKIDSFSCFFVRILRDKDRCIVCSLLYVVSVFCLRAKNCRNWFCVFLEITLNLKKFVDPRHIAQVLDSSRSVQKKLIIIKVATLFSVPLSKFLFGTLLLRSTEFSRLSSPYERLC